MAVVGLRSGALTGMYDLPVGKQPAQLAGLEQEAAYLVGDPADVKGRDEQPAGPHRPPDLREQRPVQEVEVAHQIVLALDAEAGRLDVRDLPQDSLGDA